MACKRLCQAYSKIDNDRESETGVILFIENPDYLLSDLFWGIAMKSATGNLNFFGCWILNA